MSKRTSRSCRHLGGTLLAVSLTLQPYSAHAGTESLLDEAGKLLNRAITGEDKPGGDKQQHVDAPRHIAVLPATGQGTPEQLEDIRTAIHNSLSAKSFELERPHETDRALTTAGFNPNALLLEDPAAIATKLKLDGVLYVDVLAISKVYAGAYAHQEVSVRLRLYSLEKKAFIWEQTDTQVEREGGLSLSLFGILTTVVTSAKVLTEGVRQALVDRMARGFANTIPQPSGGKTKVHPPVVQLALSNWEEGPFRAGDEVIVYLKSDPGLAANFDLGRDNTLIPMEEKANGEYVGTYVVRQDDNVENLLITVHLTRISPRTSLDWRVPGRIKLDNRAPRAIETLAARPVREGVLLSWQSPDTAADAPIFMIERGDVQSGNFTRIAEVNTSEYLDRTTASNQSYFYRLTPRDAARNQGPASTVRVFTVAPGPTQVSAEIAEDTTFHALGSPYRIDGKARVLRTATLTLAPGVVVEFMNTDSRLEILGGLRAEGSEAAPIGFSGKNWHLTLTDTGSREQLLKQTRFEGKGATMEARGSQLRFQNCVWREMETALLADDQSRVIIESGLFTQNATALRLANAQTDLHKVEFRGNETALVTGEGGVQAQGVLFDGNRVHVEASKPLNLGAALFRESTYEALIPRLHGPVQIDWAALPEEHNLLKHWVKREWQGVMTAMRANDMPGAIVRVKAIAPHLDSNTRTLAHALEMLSGTPSEEARASQSPFVQAVTRLEARQPGSAWIWLQDTALPYEAGLADSPSRLIDAAGARFARTLVNQRYTPATPSLAAKASALDLLRHQRARLLLHGDRDGAYWGYQVAYVIDRPTLERELRLAGVIQRDKSQIVIGLLNQSERGDAAQYLADALQKQKIRFVDLGQGGYTARAQQKAKEAGVDFVLEASYQLDTRQTKLSTSLKRFDARLGINLYDAHDTLVLQRYTSAGSSTDFRDAAGTEKALEQAFTRIESEMMAGLWKLDEDRRQAVAAAAASAAAAKPEPVVSAVVPAVAPPVEVPAAPAAKPLVETANANEVPPPVAPARSVPPVSP